MNEKNDVLIAAAKTLPGIVMWGLTLNELIGYATLAFIIVQMAYLMRKWWREESALLRKFKKGG